MKKLSFLISIIFVSFLLTGCDTLFRKPEIIYETKTIVLAPPQELMQKVVKPQPPSKKVYLSSSLEDREELLTDLINKQMLIIDQANLTIGKIKDWVDNAKAKQTKEVTK